MGKKYRVFSKNLDIYLIIISCYGIKDLKNKPFTVLWINRLRRCPGCHVSKPTVVKSQEFMKGEQPVTVSHMSRLVQTEKDWRAMTNVAKPREALEYRRDRRKYNARSALCIRCDCCGLRCEHYLTANHSRLILRVTVVVSSRYRLLQLRSAVW